MAVESGFYSDLFPTAVSGTLYGFDGTYEQEAELIPGRGYWLNFGDGVGVATISGNIIEELTIFLDEGWNLISGISEDVLVDQIHDPDGIIVPGTLYGFSDTYTSSEQLDPGQGYWINANADGAITLY